MSMRLHTHTHKKNYIKD